MKRLLKTICVTLSMLLFFSFAGCGPEQLNNEFAEYKVTAKATLEGYAEAKGRDNYTEEDWAAIGGFVADGKTAIDAAGDKDAVDSAVMASKQAIDAISQNCNHRDELAEYKTAAKAVIEAYAEAKGQGNYTKEDWITIAGIVADGKAEVDAAADKSGADTAVAAAKQAIDEIPMKDYEYKEGDFSLEVTVDKTTASVGDLIEITAIFKNLSGRELPILFHNFYPGDKIENFMHTGLFKEGLPIEWAHHSGGFPPTQKILGKDAVLKVTTNYEHHKIEKWLFDYVACAFAYFYIGTETDADRYHVDNIEVFITSDLVKIIIV